MAVHGIIFERSAAELGTQPDHQQAPRSPTRSPTRSPPDHQQAPNTCVGTGTRSDGRPPHVCDGGLERYNRLWRLLLIQPTASREEVNRSSREEVNRSSREEVNRSSQEEVNRSSQEEVNRSRPVACTPPIHGHADPPGTADTLTYRPIAATDHRHHSSC